MFFDENKNKMKTIKIRSMHICIIEITSNIGGHNGDLHRYGETEKPEKEKNTERKPLVFKKETFCFYKS